MEEHVGQLWHRLITRAARQSHPQAAVALEEVATPIGVFFRALGGDGGLQVQPAEATDYRGRRSLLQRVAGSQRKVRLAWRDEQALRLPPAIDWFADPGLNRDLYFWLAALAATPHDLASHWVLRNQQLCRVTLERFPGLRPRYRRLLEAHLAQRPDPGRLPAAEAEQERLLQQALREPGSVDAFPEARREPWPVPLWLHPSPPLVAAATAADPGEGSNAHEGGQKALENEGRRRAERVEKPQEDRGLVTIRMENIFSWSEYVKVDRSTDDEEDLDQAADAARDMDTLSVTRDDKPARGRLKFDLDLPAEANDDTVLTDGLLLPEWDHRKGVLVPEHCRISLMSALDAVPIELPEYLRPTARRLRNQFSLLTPGRQWLRAQPDGSEIDLDAYLRYAGDRQAGIQAHADGLFRDLRQNRRDLSCLLMADLSLSTDTWIDNDMRVIDVIRDALFLFAETLSSVGDPFALYGFSSRKRDPVRVHQLKDFGNRYDGRTRARIQAIKPGYYTRMGAAIRYATRELERQATETKLLLLLTDGKPNDLDRYEGRYGIEDTRQAIIEARAQGLQPFCVTIDARGNDYLPYLFGRRGYAVIHRPSQLPRTLPVLYSRLTAA
ncbi:MAG: nitric oxide reductase [Gammaproteobacteria bacterium]|nr:nitric oxide reductase [Gammaproteobacteria bacterium]